MKSVKHQHRGFVLQNDNFTVSVSGLTFQSRRQAENVPVINISASRADHYVKQGANHPSNAVNFQIRIL
jgi:hypothetical protein